MRPHFEERVDGFAQMLAIPRLAQESMNDSSHLQGDQIRGGISRNQQAPTVRVSAAKGFQQSDTVHARHTEVTDDQIGAELMGNSQCRFRIFGCNYSTEVAQLPKE